jgi:hypothetical protein
MLFDWLITGQIVPVNPAATVRGPKHVVKTGKTAVLDAKEWRKLLDSIPTETLRDRRDRALIATLAYSFARINAALKMKVEDLRPKGAGWQLTCDHADGLPSSNLMCRTRVCATSAAVASRSMLAKASPAMSLAQSGICGASSMISNICSPSSM